VSVIWHGLQLFLFTVFFKVELPAETTGNELGVLEISLERDEPTHKENSKQIEINIGENEEAKVSFTKREEKHVKVPMISQANVPKIEKKLKSKKIKENVAPVIKKKTEIAHTVHPFKVAGGLEQRKIIFSPELPAYPDWALQAEVSLKTKIGLLVGKEGDVKRAWVIEPSGDSRTDNKILNFTENLKFARKPFLNKGTIDWEFKIEY